jgi:hypothetical protein
LTKPEHLRSILPGPSKSWHYHIAHLTKKAQQDTQTFTKILFILPHITITITQPKRERDTSIIHIAHPSYTPKPPPHRHIKTGNRDILPSLPFPSPSFHQPPFFLFLQWLYPSPPHYVKILTKKEKLILPHLAKKETSHGKIKNQKKGRSQEFHAPGRDRKMTVKT